MNSICESFESVAVSTRMRLARNFADFPFPGMLMRDAHAEEQAQEIERLVGASLAKVDDFTLYEMRNLTDERANLLVERNLISRDLLRHRPIASALVSRDQIISIMLNEEDHVREQYFMQGFDLAKAYERIMGLDDVISESIPFAYDDAFGYLTACPTNLGTGLRASVMLFLPALSRRGVLARRLLPALTSKGLTGRGTMGGGSGAEGDLFQVSNERTLGISEEEILTFVEQAIVSVVEMELLERARMKAEGGIALKDRVSRAHGILTHCCVLEEHEFARRIADLKLGLALGYFQDDEPHEDRAEDWTEEHMWELDELCVVMRPAGINRLNGTALSKQLQDVYRAEYVRKAVSGMRLELM